MKKFTLYLAFILVLGLTLFVLVRNIYQNKKTPGMVSNNSAVPTENSASAPTPAPDISQAPNPASEKPFKAPLNDSKDRITKKPFGIYITPKTSPVQPERFMGYHTGTDFEIFPSELDQEVVVHAVCGGKIILAQWVSGYGNVMVESCQLNNHPVTIIYGHLSFSGSAFAKLGSAVSAGDAIAILGAEKSRDTDGERKHLHLGIHKGSSVVLLGYVQSQSALSGWFNPADYINL